MTEREALQDIVCKIGVLTYGKERWFKQNGCWYDRMNCDYIQNETLVERVCTELDEEYADRKTEPTISKEEIISNARLVGYQDGVKACNKEWLVRLGYKSQYGESQTETEIAKAIVHKMIDDAVIAEDAYPDLRQRMHDAVDEYEPQTERSE